MPWTEPETFEIICQASSPKSSILYGNA